MSKAEGSLFLMGSQKKKEHFAKADALFLLAHTGELSRGFIQRLNTLLSSTDWYSDAELPHSIRTYRREEIDQIPIRITEQQRTISPGHGGWLLKDLVCELFDAFIVCIYIPDEKFDDNAFVACRLGDFPAEKIQGSGAPDSQDGRSRNDFCKVVRVPGCCNACYLFEKKDQPMDVGCNDP
jgi:hypothetical protein